MKKILPIVILLLLLSAFFISCQNGKNRYSKDYTGFFDTVCTFTAYCEDEEEFERIAEKLHDKLEMLNKLFDIYNSYDGITNLKDINDNAGKKTLSVCDEIIDLLTKGKEYYFLSDGKLNIAMGSVLALWHDCFSDGNRLPDESQLIDAGNHCDINSIQISDNSVYLSDAMTSIDVGAIAKGYSADLCAGYLTSLGLENFALNLGGNVITRGTKNGEKWKIGIRDPENNQKNSAILNTENISVVTSGNYERYFVLNGVRYHHIISSDSLYPAGIFSSVTVVGSDSLLCDAMSTALFCMSYDCGKSLAEAVGVEVMWISVSGELYKTEGFSAYE